MLSMTVVIFREKWSSDTALGTVPSTTLATVPSRGYHSLAGYGTEVTVPSRLDGTVAGEATVPSRQSRSRYR